MKNILTLLLLLLTFNLIAQEKPLTHEEAEAYLQSTEHRDMTVYYDNDDCLSYMQSVNRAKL